MSPLALADVNALDRDAFVRLLGPAFESSPWVAEEAFAARPFADLEALQRAMASALDRAPAERVLELVRAHPDLAGKAAIAGELTDASTREQASAGLDRLTPEEHRRFHALNAAYRQRFGFPFVVCVREHTRESILRAFEQRLGNDRDAELAAALAEVRKIASLRLSELLT